MDAVQRPSGLAAPHHAQTQASVRSASAALRFSLRQAFAQLLFAEKTLEVSRDIRDMRKAHQAI